MTDEQIDEALPIGKAIERIEQAFAEHAKGVLVSPPRFTVPVENGSLVFTAGGARGNGQAIGFRVYETFPKTTAAHTQLVAAFDSETGEFLGLAIGYRLGIIRTSAIGGVALKYLSKPNSKTIGIIGSGTHARAQLEAALAVRDLKHAKVFSPTKKNRESFAEEMTAKLSIKVEPVDSSEASVIDSDIIICSTRSKVPVFDADLLQPGMHVTTMAQNLEGSNEVEVKVAEKSHIIVSDSLAQVDKYGEYTSPYFLANTVHRARMKQLSDTVTSKTSGRVSDDEITMFCSVGLAGTEVLLANLAFRNQS
jgi:ornithine cyclodeaminase